MSITRLLTQPETRSQARAILDPLLPAYERSLDASTLVESVSPHPNFVGIAFDYAVRMEASRLAKSVQSGNWAAEVAVALLPVRSAEVKKAKAVVEEARAAGARWPRQNLARFREQARHAAKLAQLDQVVRPGLPPTFGEASGVAEAGIAAEVVELLEHAEPLWKVVRKASVWLNPTFGDASAMVGGADADLIAGDTLIEIKTTKAAAIERDQMRQLIGYVCLARASAMYQVNNVAVYSSRFAALQVVPLRPEVNNADYLEAAEQLGLLWQNVQSRLAS